MGREIGMNGVRINVQPSEVQEVGAGVFNVVEGGEPFAWTEGRWSNWYGEDGCT